MAASAPSTSTAVAATAPPPAATQPGGHGLTRSRSASTVSQTLMVQRQAGRRASTVGASSSRSSSDSSRRHGHCRLTTSVKTKDEHGDSEGIELQSLPSTPISTPSSREGHADEGDPNNGRAEEQQAAQSFASRRSSAHTPSDEARPRNGAGGRGIRNRVQRFWREHVSMSVEHSTCRDHLALERTYLGYFRTSTLTATIGVLVAQLYLLDESSAASSAEDGKTRAAGVHVGRPLATACFAMALWIIIWGTCRYLRFQQALVRGRALSGGFEVTFVLGIGFVLLVGLFVISIVSEI
ncbi:hypothetical protein Micbo1qcDRAFT_225301 [Microdochium bolleyi]|uniref:DUF202 domain-containing protein n=1 Tax=Microdochium bolleyi TaxID=196109 RepID=A0A136J2I3_9PEZI|nr:hypothetical protein Micbo1qcDRAFT_225301 [Microdochium bolleyi]